MTTEVVVLNGGSSAGKTSIARCLLGLLPGLWLTLGVDDLVDAIGGPGGPGSAISFGPAGEVVTRDAFHQAERAWYAGLAAMAKAGAGIVVDEVLLGGGAAQARLAAALAGLDVLWVGVRCPAEVAAEREAARADRAPGMAASQAELVHQGVRYDLEVDTAAADAAHCARAIAARVGPTSKQPGRAGVASVPPHALS